jgi:hypothetical protein
MHDPAMTGEAMEIGDFIGSSLRVEAPFLPQCAASLSSPVQNGGAAKWEVVGQPLRLPFEFASHGRLRAIMAGISKRGACPTRFVLNRYRAVGRGRGTGRVLGVGPGLVVGVGVDVGVAVSVGVAVGVTVGVGVAVAVGVGVGDDVGTSKA